MTPARSMASGATAPKARSTNTAAINREMRRGAALLCAIALCGCGDRINTVFDDYGRSVSIVHTQEGIQGPILVEIGQFDAVGKFIPIAGGSGETLVQSVLHN